MANVQEKTKAPIKGPCSIFIRAYKHGDECVAQRDNETLNTNSWT